MHTAARSADTPPDESSALPQAMRVLRHDAYGGFDGLRVVNADLPTIGDDEVLVGVEAVGLHAGDCFTVRGAPFPVRFMSGLWRPKHGVPGWDLAGRVVAVGRNVRDYAPGDSVFGSRQGTCAEYVAMRTADLAPLPVGLNMIEAAALPTSGLAALHGMRDAAKVSAGMRVLINGASGGVGTYAVQIARHLGAEVTGVCSSANVELVRSLGAHHVIDYTREDFCAGPERYDVIFDNVENRSLDECRRVLTDEGLLLLNSGTGAKGLAMFVRMVKPLLLSPFVRHNLRRYFSEPNAADLLALKALAEAGSLRPVIAETYPLEQTPEALARIEAGHVAGKLVVRL